MLSKGWDKDDDHHQKNEGCDCWPEQLNSIMRWWVGGQRTSRVPSNASMQFWLHLQIQLLRFYIHIPSTHGTQETQGPSIICSGWRTCSTPACTPPSSILAQWIFLITFVLVRVIEFSVSVRTTYTLMIILSQQHCPLDMMMSAIRFNWTSLPECSAAVRMSTRGCRWWWRLARN